MLSRSVCSLASPGPCSQWRSPAFVNNLSASKLSEPVEGLHRIVVGAVAHSEGRSIELSFPPSAPLTPAEVPRGESVQVDPNAWNHLTWRSLKFKVEGPQSFSYRFDSAFDGQQQTDAVRCNFAR